MIYSDKIMARNRAMRWAEEGVFCFAGGVQSQVNGVPSPGIAGDFADNNPGFRTLSGPGGLVSGGAVYGQQPTAVNPATGGTAVVGRFGWLSQQAIDPDNAATIVNSFFTPGAGAPAAMTGVLGAGAPDGFISRPDSPAVITVYLADATMVIQEGAPVPLWAGGRAFWVKNDGTTQALVGQKAYADLATGKVSFAATGSAGTASVTGSIAAGTWSATGSIVGNVMTVGTVTGYVAPGATVTGTGVTSGTVVTEQLSGVAGAAGTYALNIAEQSVAAGASLSGTFGTLTAASGLTGTIEIGGFVTGSGVSTGTQITGFGTGAGGLGTYYVNLTQTASSTSLTITTNVETNWVCRTQANPGEVCKISTILQ